VSATRVFRTADVAEDNSTRYPPAFRPGVEKRHARRLGDHGGLTNFGVNLVRVEPGGISSQRHWHTKQDEFVMVLEGELVLVTDAGERSVGPGDCATFPAGSRDGHRFVNRSARDAVFLVVGDRLPGDEAEYPDVDLAFRAGPGRVNRFTRKDGTPY